MRIGLLAWGSVALGVLGGVLRPCAGAEIQVVTGTAQNTTLHVGDTIAVTVQAGVLNPQDGNDGIFTFDQNFIVASEPGGGPSPLQIVSVTRGGVDDLLFGGSDGTSATTGVNAIYGGYDGDSEGVGGPITLYTVELRAVGEGTATLSSGPSVNPYLADFTLNESVSPSVDYLIGPTIQVVAAPEPCVATGVLGMAICVFGSRRRRLAH